MTETTKEIKKLASWCQEARAIMGKGFQGDSSKMEKQIDDVAAMLKKLSKVKNQGETDKKLLAAGLENFRLLTSEHQRLTEAYKEAVAARKKTKDKSPEYAKADEAVTAAREKVRGLIQQMGKLKESMVADSPLAEAIHFFEVTVGNAEKKIKTEMQNPRANEALLQDALRTLTRWREDVASMDKYQEPAQVKSVTEQIKPLLSKLIGSVTKESGVKREADKNQAEAKPRAEQKLKEVEALLLELTESGQLVPALGQQFATAIKNAKLKFAEEQWIAGSALLAALPGRKACLKQFDIARVQAGVNFGPELEQSRLALAMLKTQADENTWARFNGADLLLQGRAGSPGNVKNQVEVLQRLREHIAAMKAEIQFGVQAKGRVAQMLVELKQKKVELEPVVALNRIEENRRQIELIELLQREKRWKEAQDTAKLLATGLALQSNPDFERWRRVASELGPRALVNDLRMAVGNPGSTPALKDGAQLLLTRIGRVAQLTEARDWTALMALHTEAKAFVLGLAQAIQKFKDFAGGRGEADDTVQPRLQRCSSALSELAQALKKAGADAAPVLLPLQGRLDELKAEWKKRLASAAEAVDLNQAQMEQELNLLHQAILSANYGKNIEETASAQREAAGKAEFDQLLAALERDGLAPLELLSVSDAAKFRKEIATLSQDVKRETDTAQPWAQRLLGLQALAGRVTSGITEAEKNCADLNRALGGKADAVALVLSAAKEELKSKGIWGSLSFRYEPMFSFLEQELAGLRELLTTTNATAAEGNRKLLEDLKKRADDLVKLATHNKGLDGREERVANVEKQLEALRKDGLDKLVAELDGNLGTQLKELKRDMFGMEPQVMNQALDEIGAALTGARKELDAQLDKKKKVNELKADLQPRVNTLKQQQGEAAEYFTALLKRIDAAVKQAGTAANLSQAVADLEAVAAEVARAQTEPKAALAQLKLQKTEEHAKALLKKEYEGRLKVLDDIVLPRARKAVSGAGGDGGQITELDRMFKQAAKQAKGGNHEQALLSLTRIENRLVEIEKNPAGTALGDRNALPKHVETFVGQMTGLRDQLGEFVNLAVAKAPEAARVALRQSLEDTVLKVKAQLNPRLFDLYIDGILDKDKKIAERRALRDQALQRLRELQVYISKQPTVVKLANNPVLPLLGPLQLVDTSLTRLDAHLRAAVR